jgi:hypothetical protein
MGKPILISQTTREEKRDPAKLVPALRASSCRKASDYTSSRSFPPIIHDTVYLLDTDDGCLSLETDQKNIQRVSDAQLSKRSTISQASSVIENLYGTTPQTSDLAIMMCGSMYSVTLINTRLEALSD